MDTSAGLLIAGALGLVAGVAITLLWQTRGSRRAEPSVPSPPSLAAGADAVLSVLAASTIVLDSSDEIVRRSAQALELGILDGTDRLHPEELTELVRQVRRDGQVRESDVILRHRRAPDTHVHVRVAPLGSGLVLIAAQDRTHERRVEAIRRDFVANVSHELKTPIGALNLLAEAVGEARDEPEAVERFSARMQTESERLTRLVQQIIDLSRLQNDTLSTDATTVKVGELVAEACEHSATEAEGKHIRLLTSVQPELLVQGDRAQLHAAVSNLVENAVTYSPEGSRVAVTAEEYEGDVRISVTDHGVGIPESELDRIFERFYRVDPARARTSGGTGLGLSIVKHVAASNGGTVEVWSEPGSGSTFTLVLPEWTHDTNEEQP